MPTMPGTFRPKGWRSDRDRQRLDDRLRGSASERGYDHSWSKASKRYREAHPLCVGCLAVGRTTGARLVDHVEPHKGDRDLFWDEANWQASCQWHHDVVKQLLERMWQAGEIGADDLRLDGAVAMRLTRARDPGL